MAKSILKIKARNLREKGESVKNIARKLKVSKGTASLWVRDVILSVEQLEKLRQNRIKGGELGRLKGAFMQKQRRLDNIENSLKDAIRSIGTLTEREMLVSGVALYWAEGSKKTREVSFCNSDPKLIIFLMNWLNKIFGITRDRLVFRIGINEAHRKRDVKVRNYWAKMVGVSLSQFRKTTFKVAKSKKIYQNFEDHYGTLVVRVLKPGQVYYRIMGLIEALGMAG